MGGRSLSEKIGVSATITARTPERPLFLHRRGTGMINSIASSPMNRPMRNSFSQRPASRRNVGIGDLPGGAHFVEESLARVLVAGRALRNKFQRHGVLESEVGGAVDLSHPAAAEQIDHSVVPGKKRSSFEDPVKGACLGDRPGWKEVGCLGSPVGSADTWPSLHSHEKRRLRCCARAYWVDTAMLTVWLGTPPIVRTTGTEEPAGTPVGISMFSWRSPATEVGTPPL